MCVFNGNPASAIPNLNKAHTELTTFLKKKAQHTKIYTKCKIYNFYSMRFSV